MNRIKAIIEHGMVGNDIELRILGLPFGGHSQGKDRHRQFFDMKTDFQMEPGDQIPATYFHGQALKKGNDPMPEFYGKATLTHFDRRGGWFEMTVPEGAKHHQRISNALEENRLRASTGVAGILARFEQNGHATLWVPGELSIVDADAPHSRMLHSDYLTLPCIPSY